MFRIVHKDPFTIGCDHRPWKAPEQLFREVLQRFIRP